MGERWASHTRAAGPHSEWHPCIIKITIIIFIINLSILLLLLLLLLFRVSFNISEAVIFDQLTL